MGNPYPEEFRDIIEIQKLIEEHVCLKRYLSHHLRNSLIKIDDLFSMQDFSRIPSMIDHILEDLKRVGL